MQHHLARRLAAGLATTCTLILAAACSSTTAGHGTADPGNLSGPANGTPATGSGSTSPSASQPGGDGGQQGTRQIGKSIWYGGFKVIVDTAAMGKDKNSGDPQVQFATRFANQGDDVARFDSADVDLASRGNHYRAAFSLDGTPEVPGNAAGNGQLAFDVDSNFSFDDAVLTFGSSDTAQAVMPLGGSGTMVAHEPVSVKLTGSTTSDQLRAQLTAGEVRADKPRRHDQARHGSLSLKVVVDVTLVRANIGDSYALAGDNFALTLPDGTQVATVDTDNLIKVLQLKSTLQGAEMWFDIPGPAKGRYLLMLTDNDRSPKPRLTTAIAFTLNASV
jgi:hypothetical protein